MQFVVPSGKDEIWKFVEMVSDKGYPAYMFTRELGGEKHYHAHMGTYDSIVEAIDAAVALQKEIRVEYEIVHANTNKVVNLRKGQDRQDQTALPSDQTRPETLPLPEEALPEPMEPPALIAEPDAVPESAGSVHALVEPFPASKPTPLEKDLEQPLLPSDREPQAAASEPEPLPAAAPAQTPPPKPEPSAAKPKAEATPKPAPQFVTPQPEPAPKPAPRRSDPSAVAETPRIAAVNPLHPPESTAPLETLFLLQLHSFSIQENALKAAREYSARGLPNIVVILLYDDAHRPWYVVSLGHYRDKGTALRAAREFEERENRSLTLNEVDASFLETRVVPHGGLP